MDGLRVFVHAAAFVIGAALLGLLGDKTGSPLLLLAVHWIAWANYIPFGIAASSGMHNHKGVLVLLVAGVLLLTSPDTSERLAVIMAPIGIGLLVGSIIRNFTKEKGNYEPRTTSRRGEPGASAREDYGPRDSYLVRVPAPPRSHPPQPGEWGASIPDDDRPAPVPRRPPRDAGETPRVP
jgi:hypothetical protein